MSRRILDQTGRLKWAVREPSVNPSDNGWRFFSDVDDDAFINSPDNIVVSDFNEVADLEPAIIAIYTLPVGSDLQLVVEDGLRQFIDNSTGNPVEADAPPAVGIPPAQAGTLRDRVSAPAEARHP